LRYESIYLAFLAAGIPLIRLGAGQKRLRDPAVQSQCRSIEEIDYYLQSGQNLGVVSYSHKIEGPINPHRFAVLDIDRWVSGIDLSPFTWRVRRPGQAVRAHYWFRFAGEQPLKVAKYKRVFDLAPWNTVMPGSTHSDGSEYVLEFIENGQWVEWDGESFSILELPYINPWNYLPAIPPTATTKGTRQIANPTVWVTATGRAETRRKKARYYLQYAAAPSICHQGAHNALFLVVVNLRLYFKIEWPEALHLIRTYYDRRCIWDDGRAYPWSEIEIKHKWDDAGAPGKWPSLGAADGRALARARTQALDERVKSFLMAETEEGGTCIATDLRQAFEAWRGEGPVSSKAFGGAVRRVLGAGTSTSGGGRRYVGFHVRTTLPE